MQDIPISVAERVIEDKTSQEIAFLENDRLDAVGYGRSLMPDDEHHRRDHEVDVGARYTNIYLQSLPYLAQRIRLIGRYRFEQKVTGWLIGLGTGAAIATAPRRWEVRYPPAISSPGSRPG